MCVVLIHYTSYLSINVVLASAFTLTVGTANLVINAYLVDIFPPHIRSHLSIYVTFIFYVS